MRTFRWLEAVAVVGLLALAASTWAQEEKVPLDKVPAKVKDAVKAKYPKAEILVAVKEVEDGKTFYEFELKEGNKTFEAKFDADGRFVES